MIKDILNDLHFNDLSFEDFVLKYHKQILKNKNSMDLLIDSVLCFLNRDHQNISNLWKFLTEIFFYDKKVFNLFLKNNEYHNKLFWTKKMTSFLIQFINLLLDRFYKELKQKESFTQFIKERLKDKNKDFLCLVAFNPYFCFNKYVLKASNYLFEKLNNLLLIKYKKDKTLNFTRDKLILDSFKNSNALSFIMQNIIYLQDEDFKQIAKVISIINGQDTEIGIKNGIEDISYFDNKWVVRDYSLSIQKIGTAFSKFFIDIINEITLQPNKAFYVLNMLNKIFFYSCKNTCINEKKKIKESMKASLLKLKETKEEDAWKTTYKKYLIEEYENIYKDL